MQGRATADVGTQTPLATVIWPSPQPSWHVATQTQEYSESSLEESPASSGAPQHEQHESSPDESPSHSAAKQCEQPQFGDGLRHHSAGVGVRHLTNGVHQMRHSVSSPSSALLMTAYADGNFAQGRLPAVSLQEWVPMQHFQQSIGSESGRERLSSDCAVPFQPPQTALPIIPRLPQHNLRHWKTIPDGCPNQSYVSDDQLLLK